MHTVFRPSHTPRWFTSTPPIRVSNGSDGRHDLTCCIGSYNVRAASKASDAAEHTKHISCRPCPSLSKRFRCPTVGTVCSCLKAPSPEYPVYSDWSAHTCLSQNCTARQKICKFVRWWCSVMSQIHRNKGGTNDRVCRSSMRERSFCWCSLKPVNFKDLLNAKEPITGLFLCNFMFHDRASGYLHSAVLIKPVKGMKNILAG